MMMYTHRCIDCMHYRWKLEDAPDRCANCGGELAIDGGYHPGHPEAVDFGGEPGIDGALPPPKTNGHHHPAVLAIVKQRLGS